MKKILVIQTAFLGDAILSASLIETLHRDLPGADISILVRKGNETLFDNHPFLEKVLVWNKRTCKTRNLFRLLGTIRKRKYDLVINLQRFASTGFLTAFSGARETRGFSKNPFSMFFTHRYVHKIGTGEHETERNHRLVEDLCSEGTARPRLYPSVLHKEEAESFSGKGYYTAAPASVWFTKRWPEEKWVELLGRLDKDTVVLLIGAPGDSPLAERIISASSHPAIKNLCGQLSLLGTASLMAGARMNFTNDSAPLHLASAMNAPVTAIFCSTVPAFGFGPLSDRSMIVEANPEPDCRPCGLHGLKQCPESHFRCAFDIDAGQVINML